MPGFCNSATLKILLDDTTVFVRPSPAPELVPSNDPILRGSVVLTLPKPKRIKTIIVKLVKYCNISFPDDFVYEAVSTTEAKVAICSSKEERLFDKGQHTFLFTIIIPASIATYERCQYGRIYHKLQACAKGDGLMESDVSGDLKIHIIGNPSDEGETQNFNARIENHLDETGPYAITIASQHLTVGGLVYFDLFLAGPPTPLNILSLSTYVVAKFRVSSIQNPKKAPQTVQHKRLVFLVDLSNPPDFHALYDANGNEISLQRSDIHALPPTVTEDISKLPSSSSMLAPLAPCGPTVPSSQSTSFQHRSEPEAYSYLSPAIVSSRREQERIASFQPRAIPPTSPIVSLPVGASYHVSHISRLPSDEFIRPSTLQGTNTPIEVSHDLVLEMKFEVPGKGNCEVLRVLRPLTISSCCCMVESLLVPTYSETNSTFTPSPSTSPTNSSPISLPPVFSPPWRDNCICERPTDWLIATQERLGGRSLVWERSGPWEPAGCSNTRQKAEYRTVTEVDDIQRTEKRYPLNARCHGCR